MTEIAEQNELRAHPVAEEYPFLEGSDFTELVEDIRANGLRDPITLTPDRLILDGRNRYRACREAAVEPAFETYHGNDLVEFVASRNLFRRHLTDARRAMIAGKLAKNSHGGYRHGVKSPDELLTLRRPTQRAAAEIFQVSLNSVKRARVVHTHGTAALAASVKTGAVPLTTATRVAQQLPAEEQDDYVARVQDGADPREIAPPAPTWGADHTSEKQEDMNATVTELHPEPKIPMKQRRRGTGKAGVDAKYRYVQVGALHHISEQLDALGVVLDSAEGLDPKITADEAVRWADDLTTKGRRLKQLLKLLKGA